MKKALHTEGFESCILCRQQTDVPVTLPVDLRRNYVVGLGQLCDGCGRLLVRDEVGEGGLSDRYIAALLDSCRREK